jgi:hypothetical protein
VAKLCRLSFVSRLAERVQHGSSLPQGFVAPIEYRNKLAAGWKYFRTARCEFPDLSHHSLTMALIRRANARPGGNR